MGHGKKQDDLTNTNQNMETEFVRKLKDIEQNCVETENEVDTLKLEKDAMMEEIVEAERQVMLWERKIHLEKEMQEALDPSVGQAETTAMKKEIHRMELRYEQLPAQPAAVLVAAQLSALRRQRNSRVFWLGQPVGWLDHCLDGHVP